MGVIQFEISESDFSRKLSSHYELSILQRMDSFVFMATDERQRLLLLRDYHLEGRLDKPAALVEELRSFFSRETVLRLPFRNIRLGLVTEKHTLIPKRLYNPLEKDTYLEQMTTLPGGWQIESDDLHGLGAHNVYAYPGGILSFIRQQFPGCRIFHSATAFLQTHRSLSAFLEGRQLFVHVWPQQLQLILYEGNDLLFVNMFNYQSARDFIYYLMLVFDQFDLDPKKAPVRLSGQISSDSEIHRLLTRYVSRVEPLAAPAYLQLGKAYHSKPAYYYYDLFTLLPCN